MIGSLRGTVLDRSARGEVLVEVAGLGYRVQVAPSTLAAAGAIGDTTFLFVHHHLREDASTLYGFATIDERNCFEALLGAHGVGPALAMAILSVHRPDELRRALAADDVAALCLVPGVGKKTAARLLIELKARLDAGALDLAAIESAIGADPSHTRSGGSTMADVRDALTGLGYGPEEIRDALRDLPADGDTTVLLREALQRMAVVR